MLTKSSLNQKKRHNSKLLQKENMKPSEALNDAQANQIGCQEKKKNAKATPKKKAKETEKTDNADPDFQDQDGARKKAPKKSSKKRRVLEC